MGNGIYDYAFSTPVTTGAANTPTTLFSRNIAAGGLNDGNCMRLRCEFDRTGPNTTASVEFRLGSTDLLLGANWAIASPDYSMEVEIWRVGRYAALVRPSFSDAFNGPQWELGGRFSVTSGIDWQTGQVLSVIGTASVANGLELSRAGLMK